jgi:hypothetical protein
MVNVIGQLPTGVVTDSIEREAFTVNGPWVSLGLWNGAYRSSQGENPCNPTYM